MHRVALALVLLTACGRPAPLMAPPDYEEELEGPAPTIAGIELPRLPEDVSAEDEELAGGWALTETALTMPAPRPPTGGSEAVQIWADDALADWMQRRGEAIAEAQRALREARHGEAEYSVVASLLLGLAYARFAMDLRGLETPAAFREDPDRAIEYRQAFERAARPLWERALDAFGSCASVAAGQPAYVLGRWRERCDAEAREAAAMLPDSVDDDEEEEEDDEG